MQKIIYLIIFLTFFLGYSQKEKSSILIPNTKKNLKLTDQETLNWHHKDIIDDTIPGISLEKAYRELIGSKKGKEVIIAVIDTEVDISHKDLKDQIWHNPKEVPDNNIDDDHNGYIDDIHGWNFLGNNKGENVIYTNYEFVRIIREFKTIFKNKTIDDIPDTLKEDFKQYQKAFKALEEKLASNYNRLKRIKNILVEHRQIQKELKEYLSTDSITKEQLLDFRPNDTIVEKHRKKLLYHLDSGFSEKSILGYINQTKGALKLSINLEYKEREIVGDNPNDITDTNYGNNNVSGNLDKLYHGTLVSGVLAAKRNNTIGIDGIINEAKIMALCISANGDELDKDIALAIRYAVDNGAKIINMSSGKQFSINRQWVNKAIEYAAKKDVLFITSAGNNKLNLDEQENNYYPNDNTDLEISNNFLMVGASTYTLDKKLRYYLTNYGKNNVDIFAPGYKIYTTLPNNTYRYSQGTSMATPIVAGVAALIRSHYPNLKAYQIKEILMKSGISYNIDVEMTLKDDTKKMIPFSDLSKSGKIVNAYNALLMAEQVSKGTE
ncbi:S8 family peptidase [Aquimarina longa]|uniref:S8 family peptidase n=1 Tax=Aquimarina longa TaxID=1080221 RepID=UPI000786542E|nr:S8 family peptidase [Aquimarina longa]